MAAEAKVPSVREQIPTAEFIEDLPTYMSKEGTAEAVIEQVEQNSRAEVETLQEQHAATLRAMQRPAMLRFVLVLR